MKVSISDVRQGLNGCLYLGRPVAHVVGFCLRALQNLKFKFELSATQDCSIPGGFVSKASKSSLFLVISALISK